MTAHGDLAALLGELRQFVVERDWDQFHDPKNLAMLLASEVGELVAEYRWVNNAAADEHSRQPAARARIAAELGDVGIAFLLLCQRIELDPLEAIATKLANNRVRYPVESARGKADKAEH
jgi:NTP pyrophosphatase (non-canonical NTP hydrolase)